MNKKLIALLIIIVLLIGGFITYYYLTNKDALTFKKDYESYNDKNFKYEGKNTKYTKIKINAKNPIIYIKDKDILSNLQGESKMILFGSADNDDSRKIISTLFEVAKDNGIEKIYYYPIKELEKKIEKGNKSAEKKYKEITQILNSHLTETFKNGNKKITIPTIIVVNKGKIVSFNSGTQEKKELYKTYENMMLDLIMCTDDC